MKTITLVGFAALVVATMSMVVQKALAQDPHAGHRQQGSAQPASGNDSQSHRPAPLTKEQVAKIEANLAKLRPEDRELAEAQVFCPIMMQKRLGSMGPPIKVMIKDQPAFLCCKGCQRKALANPDATLARVEQLKIRAEIAASLAKLGPEDRQLAEAQGYCPVMVKNPLGVMGKPVKIMVGNEPVFLCCAGCKRRALANPNQTLAIVADLKARVAQEQARKARTERTSAAR